jgi:predicted phosphodiesterase
MRYAVLADIHANLEALKAVIVACAEDSVDRYLCAGDIVGYAAEPAECIESLKSLGAVTVAGNHDWAAIKLFSLDYFNPLARQAILWTRDRLASIQSSFLGGLKLVYSNDDLILVHGTLEHPEDFRYLEDRCAAQESFRLQETVVCFVGHTHVPGIFVQDEKGTISYLRDNFVTLIEKSKYIVNVGSVGQPRDSNSQAAYCIYDTVKRQISIKRVSYDIVLAAKKIVSAGLPGFLAERLLLGR